MITIGIILGIISYIVTGYVVGSRMHEEGFVGGRTFVIWFGGAFWPLTGIMLLLAILSDYRIEIKKKG